MTFADRRLARKSSAPAAGVYYDQRKEFQYSDYHVGDRQRSRAATPMRFAGETKSLQAPPPPPSFTAGYGHRRASSPPHQAAPGVHLHGRPLPSTAAGSLLYYAIDTGPSGVDPRYVEHIYESPTCVRRNLDTQGGAESLEYFDIESERPVDCRPTLQESL